MSRLAADHRRAELAMIHMGATALGMDTKDQDENSPYRAMLWTLGRQRSAAKLDWQGRKRVLDHLKACGWKPTPPKPAKARKVSDEAQKKMIRGIWLELHGAGVVRDSSEAAILSYCRRQSGTELAAVQWLSSAQASKIIEALKKWLNGLTCGRR